MEVSRINQNITKLSKKKSYDFEICFSYYNFGFFLSLYYGMGAKKLHLLFAHFNIKMALLQIRPPSLKFGRLFDKEDVVQFNKHSMCFLLKRRRPRCKGVTPALRLVALSTPRDQTLSGTVLPLLTHLHHMPQCEVTGAGFVLHLSLAHILCELRRARVHA